MYLGAAQSSQIKVPSRNTVQNCTDNSSTSETEDHLQREAYVSKLKDQTYALPGYLSTVVRPRNPVDIDSGYPKKIAGH